MATYILETPIVLDDATLTREDLNRDDLEAHFGIDVFATAKVQAKYEDPTDTTLEPHFYEFGTTTVVDASGVSALVGLKGVTSTTPLVTTDTGSAPFEKFLPVSDAAAALGNYQSSTSWTSELPAVVARETSGVGADRDVWFQVGALASYFQYTTTSFAYSDFGHKEMYGKTSLDASTGQQLQRDQLLTMIRRVLSGDEADTTTDNITDSQNQFEDLRLLLLNGIRDVWVAANPGSASDGADMLVAGDKLIFIFHKKLSHDRTQLTGAGDDTVTSFDPNALTLKVAVSVEIVNA